MEEQWKQIEDYPRYEVSTLGNVRQIGKDSNLSSQMAKGGAWFVKLASADGITSKSIKVLVAEAFVPKPEGHDPDIFDTAVQLVVNTKDVRASKIVWRPRWFAIQFRRQIGEAQHTGKWDMPVMNLDTGSQHASILTAALHDGVLLKDIYRSAGQGRTTFPEGHRYEFMWRIWDNKPSVHWDGV